MSDSDSQKLHEVAITAIIRDRDGKYLIVRRDAAKKRFPKMWTVPGGRLETKDYTALNKDTKDYWYNVLERALAREIDEEVGFKVVHVEYLTSLATVHADGAPSLVISCVADYESGDVRLQEGETDDFAWVSSEEAKGYDLIDGIMDELVMADKHFAGTKAEWARS
ncbi:MAG: NUDIX domain-containing protein [bacterium]|nr:NUDIX domain-containing protein [bacterium]MDZ4248298.1 NUDIX domain-containing protein [Patescibacteria group bacterium]